MHQESRTPASADEHDLRVRLSAPADHWCPRCQIHLRSQDHYGHSADHKLMPLCPVCADDDARV